MQPTFESERLFFRPLTANDYSFMRQLHGDPEVMRYITGRIRTEEETRQGLERGLGLARDYPGQGGWMVELKSDHTIVGNFIVRPPATDAPVEGVEIGYAFHRNHWGKGYATETVRRLVQYIFDDLKEKRIIALVDPKGTDSKKVLTKLGFKVVSSIGYVDSSTGLTLPAELLELTR